MQLKFMIPGLAALAATAQATPLTIQNQCDESIAFYDNSATEIIASGGTTTRTLSSGFSGMFRNGVSAQATLAEFSITGGYTWYDISIIPTGSSGPGNCASLADCKSVTGAPALPPSTPSSSWSSSWEGSESSSSSSSSFRGSLSGNTITFPPEHNASEQTAATTTSAKSTVNTPTSAGSNDQTTTTETAASSGTPVGTIVAATVGALAVVAAVAAIVVVRRKKQQMDAASPKDDFEWFDNYSGMATPVTRIPTM
ncbi:hypothetical protein KRP22_005027 [Phytophthora ramorum]|nr:hypothetical protein KRP22_12611 [Phytophthora ramorum]